LTDAHPGVEFRERYARLVDTLRAEQPRWIRDVRTLHMPASVPPWTETGIELERGERLTVLATGRVMWSREADLFAGPRHHLWGRIGDRPVFRLGSDTHTLSAAERGALRLCIYHGTWASPDGTLATSLDAYASLQGGIDVVAIRWGDVSPEQGIAALASIAPSDPLLAAERERLGSSRRLPPGFEPLWFVGQSDIFYRAQIDEAPTIAVRADATAGIVRRPVELALRPGTFLEWSWRVNALPSRVREDALATHDYVSIALEFDDGRDLTWYWSAALPEGHHYGCPLPRWAGRETHVVMRSGPEGLGAWVDERCDVQTDAARALGRAPSHIVAVWLIAVSLFQRGLASADFRRIALVQEGRAKMIFPS
jgi:hypothetical protein